MGNCTHKALFHDDTAKAFDVIRIMTDSGHILKLKSPKMVKEIIRDFPGYKICAKGHFSTPFSDQDELAGGKMYYLLPAELQKEEAARKSSASAVEMVNGAAVEVLPPPEKGVWKVKLAITTKQLEEILSEDANTEALVEQMRMAAAGAGSATTPRRSRISWGLIWKPILGNVVRGGPGDEVTSSGSCNNSPASGGTRLENHRVLNERFKEKIDTESKVIDKLYTERIKSVSDTQ